ncbi:MAG TPA: excinuclease ABC subunit UvrA [Candidatus Magasanikbacteria bacterium]|nr:excinuclease ABC subunit UvrA [Candidatus Magasanikbacteria bacterium]
MDNLTIRGARVNNLKNINLEIPKNKLVVITGLSGSGKSSLAFDTIYAEGQRRYAESLSSYARQFMEMQDKPDVDEIKGLSPTIAIDQRSVTHNPRSTVGTVTEIYDSLRLLFARLGRVKCPDCGELAERYTSGEIVEIIRKMASEGRSLRILGPILHLTKNPSQPIEKIVEDSKAQLVRYNRQYFTPEEFFNSMHKPQILEDLEIVTAEINGQRFGNLVKAVEDALELGNGILIVDFYQEKSKEKGKRDLLLSTVLRCPKCGRRFPALEPRSFSFNSPHGACPKCTGLGITLEVDESLVMPNPRLTLAEGAIQPWMRITGNQTWYLRLLQAVSAAKGFSTETPMQSLPKKVIDLLMNGTGKEVYHVDGKETYFEGVVENLEKRHRETNSDYVRKEIEDYMREKVCSLCHGKRLKGESLAVDVFGKNISEMGELSVGDMMDFWDDVSKRAKNNKDTLVVGPIVKEISKRLKDLEQVGLDYLTLDRSMATLSGGEAQRVRLSTQLSTGLTGVIYILDEPSIGLHPCDMEKLIKTLKSLRDLGNSVIVVEHDETMMRQADYVVDIGPGAGIYGGEIVSVGTPTEIIKDKESLTGNYLSGRRQIEPPANPHKGSGKNLEIKKAAAFNLKNVDVKIPLGKLVCVTGVSGSGKSTLIIEILSKALAHHFYRAKDLPANHQSIKGLENIDKVITIDQSPIGRTPRSNPATYTGVFTAIRDLFTEVPEAKMRGYDAGKFSFNVKGGGRCEACSGDGYVRIPMQFLTDVYVECEECNGKRYNREALEIHYQNKNIADILDMTVAEARQFFKHISCISEKLQILAEVGLGYIKLGQPATKLSGGEAQRVKLATELSRRATGRTLYILDEPTTGLHFEDIKQLMKVLNFLVDKGNTVLIIEHNMDVIRGADWVIDLGPGGGKRGGEIVAEGAPASLVKIKKSLTGQYLKK